MPKICLANFDSSNCHYWVNKKQPKEEQVKHCRKLKCPYGSVTERKINDELYIIVTCDCSWCPVDNRPLTEEEKEDYR